MTSDGPNYQEPADARRFLLASERTAAAEDPLSYEALVAGAATLPRLLRAHAQRKADTRALREKDLGVWRRYDWAHYFAQAQRFALALTAAGVQRGDRIIIAGENTPEWFYADLGAEMIGAVPVGIYPTNPWPELQYIAQHSAARIAVTGDQEQTDKVLEAQSQGDGLPALERILCVDMKGMRNYDAPGLSSFDAFLQQGDAYRAATPDADTALEAALEHASPDDVALIVYTSGTTGKPKGAMLTHRNIVSGVHAYAKAVGALDKPFEAVGYLPLCHAAERCYTMAMHLVLGGTVNFAESIDTVAQNVREIAPSFFIGVPRIWEKLKEGFEFRLRESGVVRQAIARRLLRAGYRLDKKRQEGRSLNPWDRLMSAACHTFLFANLQKHLGLNRTHHRLCAGASVSPETLRFFSVIGLPISQGYGMTESAGCCFIQRTPYTRHGGCGVPIDGVEFRMDDDGEARVRGPIVFKGYFLNEQATLETVEDGWLHTGDIVTQFDNGEIAIIDRKKAIIITSGGKNIAPSEIENALKDSPYIREVIVVGDGRKFLGALIQIDFDNVSLWAGDRELAFTTYKSLTQLSEVRDLIQGVVNHVNSQFARVENIRKFVLLEKELDHDDGELTATQKVRRAVIDTKFARELEQIYGPTEVFA